MTRTARSRLGQTIDSTAPEGWVQHESFLTFSHFRYLKLGAVAAAAAMVLYVADRPYGSRYGGSWAGYTLGIVAALLVVWLTWYGYHKRSYPKIRGRLAEMLSAHVYLGLSLLFVATLHTGFQFHWNIHMLAYFLLCAVIVTGIVGVFCYHRYPRLMTENRAEMTMQQMLGRIASLDDELRLAAMPLDEATATVIERAAETTTIGGSALRQLSGRFAGCATLAAVEYLDAKSSEISPDIQETWLRARMLIGEKAILLTRVRRDISYKAIMDLWLYFHVPLSFMLLAALLAHIVSVFFLW